MNKVLIAVDLSDHDRFIYQYISNLHKIITFDEISVIHVVPEKSKFNPNPLSEDINQLNFTNFLDKIRERIVSDCNGFDLGVKSGSVQIEIGNHPFEKIAKLVNNDEYGHVILGLKSHSDHSGLTPKRVLHKIKTNVLLITDQVSDSLDRVLFPYDYSEASSIALKFAQHVSASIDCYALHVISILDYDNYFGISQMPDYIDQRIEQEKAYLSKYQEKYDLDFEGIELKYKVDLSHRIALNIKRTQSELNAHLVVMGASTHHLLDRIFIGRVTEKYVEIIDSGAVLILRNPVS